jgi:hypothetical protein
MGNYPESKISQKIIAKKIIMGVLTLRPFLLARSGWAVFIGAEG